MRTGRWIRRSHFFRPDEYYCSVCGASLGRKRRVCPDCGARLKRMKKGQWIRRTRLFRPDEYVCSLCGACFRSVRRVCPGCGAVMEKVKYDPHWVDEIEAASALLDEDW